MDEQTIKHVSLDGLELDVDTSNVDDMEFLELSDRVQKDITGYPALLKKLIGDKAYYEVAEHYKAKHGKFSVENATAVFETVLRSVDPKD